MYWSTSTSSYTDCQLSLSVNEQNKAGKFLRQCWCSLDKSLSHCWTGHPCYSVISMIIFNIYKNRCTPTTAVHSPLTDSHLFCQIYWCDHRNIFKNNISNHNFSSQIEAHYKNPTYVLFLAHNKYQWTLCPAKDCPAEHWGDPPNHHNHHNDCSVVEH